MNILTADSIAIYCLPDGARCRCTGESPELMNDCPLAKFDVFGEVCVPELCDEYEEE